MTSHELFDEHASRPDGTDARLSGAAAEPAGRRAGRGSVGDERPDLNLSVTAVVLAGGTSRRFGGAHDDKLDVSLGARSVLDSTLASLPTSWPVIVVGPPRAISREQVTWVQEDPPLGGPVAALARALDVSTGEWIALVAGDTPRGGHALPALLDAALTMRATSTSCLDGAVAVVDVRRQPLLAVYRADALAAACEAIGNPDGASMRAMLASLALAETPVDPGDARDVDTVDDLAFHRARGAS